MHLFGGGKSICLPITSISVFKCSEKSGDKLIDNSMFSCKLKNKMFAALKSRRGRPPLSP